jgi:hypothetical protein
VAHFYGGKLAQFYSVANRMSISDYTETATTVTIITLGYRARCTEADCRNLGRVVLRHADAAARQ